MRRERRSGGIKVRVSLLFGGTGNILVRVVPRANRLTGHTELTCGANALFVDIAGGISFQVKVLLLCVYFVRET